MDTKSTYAEMPGDLGKLCACEPRMASAQTHQSEHLVVKRRDPRSKLVLTISPRVSGTQGHPM